MIIIRNFRYIYWPHGQAVKTPPFHGGNMGSSPVGVTSNNLNRTPQLEGGRFGLFHFLKILFKAFPFAVGTLFFLP